MTIYVENLSYDADHDSIAALFAEFGEIKKISLPIDKITGRRKGFCFIDFEEEDNEDAAITRLNEYEFLGRCLKISKAITSGDAEPPSRSGGGFNRGEKGSGSRR
jgi:RNA recognition motif-containing protein